MSSVLSVCLILTRARKKRRLRSRKGSEVRVPCPCLEQPSAHSRRSWIVGRRPSAVGCVGNNERVSKGEGAPVETQSQGRSELSGFSFECVRSVVARGGTPMLQMGTALRDVTRIVLGNPKPSQIRRCQVRLQFSSGCSYQFQALLSQQKQRVICRAAVWEKREGSVMECS